MEANNKPHYKETTMSNLNLTTIAFVLDRSGSMEEMREQAIQGFNQFLEQQKAMPGETRFTLVLFNHEINTIANQVPIHEMVHLNWKSFVPNGNTALDDALGSTIDALGYQISQTPESKRPNKVIIAVLTDGQENSSSRYTTSQVQQMITHQQQKYNWNFIFLGAGESVVEESRARGIQVEDAITFDASTDGMIMAMQCVSEAVNVRRRR